MKKKDLISLIVSLHLDPVAWWIFPEEVFPGLVVDKDEKRERHGDQPPVPLQGVHSQSDIGTWHVGKNSSQESFLE